MKGHYYQRDCTCETESCGCTWTYVIDLGRDPLTGKRQQKSKSSFSTKQDAEIAAAELLSKKIKELIQKNPIYCLKISPLTSGLTISIKLLPNP